MLFRDKRTGETLDIDESLLGVSGVVELILAYFEPLEKDRWNKYLNKHLYRICVYENRLRRGYVNSPKSVYSSIGGF